MLPELIGYGDLWSVMPGQRIRFMVSTDHPNYEVAIVRLIHGDENPKGPGFKEEVVNATVNRQYPGRKQQSYTGSFVKVDHHPALNLSSFTLQAWVFPTTPDKGALQGLVTKRAQGSVESGYGLFVGAGGDLELWIADGQGRTERVASGKPLRASEWYFAAASYDAGSGRVTLYQLPLAQIPSDPSAAVVETTIPVIMPGAHEAPLLIGAASSQMTANRRVAGSGVYNGKIDSPRIFARALASPDIERLRQDVPPQEVTLRDLVAAWDFSADPHSNRVTDTGRNRLDGAAVNMPARAMMGHNWSNTGIDFKHAPQEYGAIHFHEEDLEDAGWEADFEWTLPDGLRSGVYAARLRAGDQEDHIPFFVRPRRGTATAPVAYLLPTFTYLAYANQRLQMDEPHNAGVTDREIKPVWLDVYLSEHPEHGLSIYDRHSDTYGCMYSSRLRPIVTLRPKYRYWLTDCPRHMAADLFLTDWLEAKGFAYDIITDEDLHAEGKELLENYRVVMTGSHPEYWTTPMMNGLMDYLDSSGRLMYLGGNGFYWVTGVDPERPHIVEVRRGIAGSRDWSSAPGELYLSTTGELGGLWRHRGIAPNRVAGIGFSGMGWDGTAGYFKRQPGSDDPRAAFIFEGVSADEPIGNFGLALGGAAGDELDRVDPGLGTPPHTLVLATSTGHTPYILPVIEDFGQINAQLVTNLSKTVHADMIYFETPGNGAVFSTGSITWLGSLSHNGYNNNVSRIMENVLRKFSMI